MTDVDTEAPEGPRGFSALGLDEKLVRALHGLGYEEPTPIQREAVPHLLAGRDLLGQAATGTGKTAAFALPLLQRLAAGGRRREPIGLVLVPTRELCVQVGEAAHRYGREVGVRVLPIYGGQPIARQLRALEHGVDIVVATPGRALDHIRRGSLRLGGLEVVVLDEADEMLDMGFAEDLDTILAELPEERQTVLFSATMPPRIDAIARRHLRDPVQVRIARESVPVGEVPRVRQTAYVVARPYKVAALGRVLDLEAPSAAIVFCRTRTEVDQLTETLTARGYRAEALHGGMSQEQRDRVMRRLRGGVAELLVATDVAARGLDIEQLSHVINYDVPSAAEAYVHRIGRVGRAGREGVAITLAEPREHHMLRNIERVTRQRIEVARVPTVADLRARRLELIRASVREAILDGESERFRVVVESLADEFDVMEVAMAAVRLAHEAGGGDVEEEEDIPEARPVPERGPRPGVADRSPRGPRASRGERAAGPGRRREAGHPGGQAVVLHIGAGRKLGIRPQDLVGAIANEAGVAGHNIGIVEIADRFSLVEVPEAVAADVIDALRDGTIRGRKVTVRRDRGPAR